MKGTRLAGHGLNYEGRALNEDAPFTGAWVHYSPGFWSSDQREGRTRCECGEWSPVLPSSAARKRWHREHKQQVAQST